MLNPLRIGRSILDRISRLRGPIGYARSLGVRMGTGCRLIHADFGSEPYLVTLGDHVSATHTRFITHDGGVWVFRDKHPKVDLVAPIRVGSNVFFGAGCIVLPGTTIGDNVIIGAGAVVRGQIPSNCVAVGIPAKPIKSLDEYWDSIAGQTLDTKGLSPSEKRDFLRAQFDRGE